MKPFDARGRNVSRAIRIRARIVGFWVLAVGLPLLSSASTLLVWTNSPAPGVPYTDWSNAAHQIQFAVDAALPGDTVLVTDGVYRVGGQVANGLLTNRLVVTKAITIRSVNGPEATWIVGGADSVSGGNGAGAVRCVYLGHGSTLIGFMLAQGATRTAESLVNDRSGGGVWCENTAVISNCVITGNRAAEHGGGAYNGTLYNCTIASNSASYGGGIYSGIVSKCVISGNGASFGGGVYGGAVRDSSIAYNSGGDDYGGGAFGALLVNCSLVRNSSYRGGAASYADLSGCYLASNSAAFGGGVFGGMLTNCVLSGNWSHGGGGAEGVTLYNCTLIGNHAAYGGGARSATLVNCQVSRNSSDWNGGGVDGCTLTNCTVSSNTGYNYGGGANGSRLINCVLSGNSGAAVGGGASSSTLINCTVSRNSALQAGGGVSDGSRINCIVYYNDAPYAPDCYAYANTLYTCTSTVMPGPGNTTAAPLLLTPSHIAEHSPCRGAGNVAYTLGSDIDGEAWKDEPSIGCDEPYQPMTGPLTVTIQASRTYTIINQSAPLLRADIDGIPASNRWTFGDGGYLDNQSYGVGHAWTMPGTYPVTLTVWNDDHPDGVSTSIFISVGDGNFYVNKDNATPLSPFMSWLTAATNIQDAVDAATPVLGAVLVTNGVYDTGGRLSPGGSQSNRLVVEAALAIRSVNGPGLTSLVGAADPTTTNAWSSLRCVYLGPGASLVGFTLTGGHTQDGGAGGAVYALGASVSNCVLTMNSATHGGGSYYGTLDNCILSYNSATGYGGGAQYGRLLNCILYGNSAERGGGAWGATLTTCSVSNNQAVLFGGGAYGGVLESSVIAGNSALYGGGVYQSSASNCYVAANSADFGGGANYGALHNSILVGNVATNGGGVCDGLTVDSLITSNSAHYGGGAMYGTLVGCTIAANQANHGGGVRFSTASNCVLMGNSASGYGGGANWGMLVGSELKGNAASQGGGAADVWLVSCTLVSNAASSGGGALNSTLDNCIVYSNTAISGPNHYSSTFSYSCTTPHPGGVGNLANGPFFVDYGAGNLRLLSNSPCINMGINQDWMTGAMDLDGNPRIYGGGRVDMGAYEYQGSTSVLPINWLASYGLAIDGSVDFDDTDGDGLNNWGEWRSRTQPTNNASFLGMLAWTITPDEGTTGLVVRWMGETGVTYRLQRGTSLSEGFGADLATNLPGFWPISVYTDKTTGAWSGPWFYRVIVE